MTHNLSGKKKQINCALFIGFEVDFGLLYLKGIHGIALTSSSVATQAQSKQFFLGKLLPYSSIQALSKLMAKGGGGNVDFFFCISCPNSLQKTKP